MMHGTLSYEWKRESQTLYEKQSRDVQRNCNCLCKKKKSIFRLRECNIHNLSNFIMTYISNCHGNVWYFRYVNVKWIPHATNNIVFHTTCHELHRIWYHMLRNTSYLIPHATNYIVFDTACYELSNMNPMWYELNYD